MTTAAAITLFAAAGAITATVVAVQELPAPQQWTVLAVLVFVLSGVFVIARMLIGVLRGIGNRLAKGLEALSEELKEDRRLNNAKHDEYAKERVAAVATLQSDLRAVPEKVVIAIDAAAKKKKGAG